MVPTISTDSLNTETDSVKANDSLIVQPTNTVEQDSLQLIDSLINGSDSTIIDTTSKMAIPVDSTKIINQLDSTVKKGVIPNKEPNEEKKDESKNEKDSEGTKP